MKVSDIITYIMKIMGFDFKKIRLSSFRGKQKSVESQRQVMRKQVGLRVLQDLKDENAPNFSGIEYDIKQHFPTVLKINLIYLELFY